jgi:AcrR family transcriptional regulator
MAVKRRLGLENSATRSALMDAAEKVMREEGYAAVSARSVAEAAHLKHQLVFYYFQSMDDLLLATLRRHTQRYWDQIEAAFRSDKPLHAFWQAHANPQDSILNMEFLALANHNEAVRKLTVEFGERVRRLGLDFVAERLKSGIAGDRRTAAFGITMAISAVGSILGLESALGINGGHWETRALVDWALEQLEPAGVRY